jgi:hypothetical protein
MALSAGLENVELVVVGDDVSVPRSRGKMVGRRCLAGITLGALDCRVLVTFLIAQFARFSARDRKLIWASKIWSTSADQFQPILAQFARLSIIAMYLAVQESLRRFRKTRSRLVWVCTTRL